MKNNNPTTFPTQKFLEISTKSVNYYVSKLKHGDTFKYVKGFTKEEKLLMNICLDRQNKGEFLRLTNKQIEAFNMPLSRKNGMIYGVAINYLGRLSIVPISEF